MNEQDGSRLRDRWQEIAEQLGLAAETSSAPAPVPPAARPKPPEIRFSQVEDRPVESPAPEVSDDLAEPPPETVDTVVEPDAEETGVAPVADRGERPRGRGRRGRRSRRRSGGRECAPADDRREAHKRDVPERESFEAETEAGGSAARGHDSSCESEPEGEPSDVDSEVDEGMISTGSTLADAEEDDNGDWNAFSNWTVPSWDELIGSLYRPDRK